jgi:dTDP-4-amino-4,6-dideoxygalactose transaminase
MAGHSANMGPIMKIAKKYGLHVVEDAACGVGVKYKRKHVGTFGITGCFSFHPRKVLTTGEGGMITINKKDVYEKIYSLKNNGKSIRSSMVFEGIGLNYKMSDILAAVGIVQLKKVKQIIKKRVELAKYYSQYLNEKVEDVKPPTTKSYSNHTFQSYIVLIERENVRDKIILELRKKGIETQIGTFAVHLLAPYRKYTKSESFPNAEYAFRNSLILPLHHKMRKKDVEYVVDSLNKVLKRF